VTASLGKTTPRSVTTSGKVRGHQYLATNRAARQTLSYRGFFKSEVECDFRGQLTHGRPILTASTVRCRSCSHVLRVEALPTGGAYSDPGLD
jgi:hypothetical protein